LDAPFQLMLALDYILDAPFQVLLALGFIVGCAVSFVNYLATEQVLILI
jgi:hypothetical protein